MKTELLYLTDTYQFSADATFLEVREHEKGAAVILDKTIFYPQNFLKTRGDASGV